MPRTPQPRPTVIRRTRVASGFLHIHSEGTVLPIDILERIAADDPRIEGLHSENYNLPHLEKLNEHIAEVWNKLLGCWAHFSERVASWSEPTERDREMGKEWLFPLLKYLDYNTPKKYRHPLEIEGKFYPISHSLSEPVLLHITPFGEDIDHRSASSSWRSSPHSLVQEYLNRSDAYLWGILTNGKRFRFLRDNVSFTQAAYLEFDLEGIFQTRSYSEFRLFFLLAHSSRFKPRQGNDQEYVEEETDSADDESSTGEEATAPDTDCWLELWHCYSRDDGVRVLDTLRDGVQKAIETIGSGFLQYRVNRAVFANLFQNGMTAVDYYHQILRLVYRIIFLLILEDRELLFPPHTPDETKTLYRNYYSLSRIRTIARRSRGSRHGDLWEQLRRQFQWLDAGEETLGIPALGSLLFRQDFTPYLTNLKLDNASLLEALRALSYTSMNGRLQPVNYRNLGTEELGSIYESLLEMHPHLDTVANTFELTIAAGNDRKTTGSYYTPPELVQSLLKTALEPVIDERLAKETTREGKINSLLSMRICDPSCGSGHFLIGAAHKLGRRLAQLRTESEGDEPTPSEHRQAVREVIAHSLYGVDLNPMAVELCKISLWIESMEPGKGLLFLDHRIKRGNSLLGTSVQEVAAGIPDEAYEKQEGDETQKCSAWKKNNIEERGGQLEFDFDANSPDWLAEILLKASNVNDVPSETANDYSQKETLLKQFVSSQEFQRQKWQADLWCLAFVIEKNHNSPLVLTTQTLRRVAAQGIGVIPPKVQREWKEMIDQDQFFHWDLEFPEIFSEKKGGFDLIIGNPPWETMELKEKEFFAVRRPDISAATGAKRKTMIAQLETTDPDLYTVYKKMVRLYRGLGKLIRGLDRFKLTARGKLNLYALFAELNTRLINRLGRISCIVPSGIATDNTTKDFFQEMVKYRRLVTLYDFENRKKIFPIDSRMKFTLLTLAGEGSEGRKPIFSFFNHAVKDLEKKENLFTLTDRDIALLNPNTRNAAIFRTVQDAELTKAIYRRVPILKREEQPGEGIAERNPWKISCSQGHFNMTTASHLFHTREDLEYRAQKQGNHYLTDDGEEYYPLYESKMIHQFTHRFGDYKDLPEGSRSTQLPNIPLDRLQNPSYTITPRYWVAESDLRRKVPKETAFLMGFRRITNTTNARTVISSIIPRVGVGNTLPVLYSDIEESDIVTLLSSLLNSFVLDYTARQKLGGTTITFGIFNQFPVLPPERFTPELKAEILPMVLELVYTAEDLRPFAEAAGYFGNPFPWDPQRRFLLRCELDAIYFGLYLGFASWSPPQEARESDEDFQTLTSYFPKPIDALDYIMRTFPIVERHERADEEKLAWSGATEEYYPSHAMIRNFFLKRC